MYINSTNLYFDLSENYSKIPASVITSEKYFNCENFFADLTHKRRRLFQKRLTK